MAIDPSLILVSALFFLSISAIFYMAAWLIASAALKLGGMRFSHAVAKRVLATALTLPPLLAAIPTVGGATLRHSHASLGMEHHSMLCEQMFTSFYRTTSLHGNAAVGGVVNGVAWLGAAAGLILGARLVIATIRLERGLAPFLQPPSQKLASILNQAVMSNRRLPTSRFYECAIPASYSSVIGLLRVRCILSSAFVREATDEELLAVVMHEGSHIQSNDVWMTLLIGAVNCLFFLVRPVRLLARRWREEAELTCDDAAVAMTKNPLAMASAILRISGVSVKPRMVRRSLPATTMAFADEAACSPQRRVERLIAQAQCAASPPLDENTWEVLGAWAITLSLAALGVAALISAQALCYAHCSLETVARLLP